MADITMCVDNDCKLKDKCYRYNAPASEFMQSYFMSSPYNKDKDNCAQFWNVEG